MRYSYFQDLCFTPLPLPTVLCSIIHPSIQKIAWCNTWFCTADSQASKPLRASFFYHALRRPQVADAVRTLAHVMATSPLQLRICCSPWRSPRPQDSGDYAKGVPRHCQCKIMCVLSSAFGSATACAPPVAHTHGTGSLVLSRLLLDTSLVSFSATAGCQLRLPL